MSPILADQSGALEKFFKQAVYKGFSSFSSIFAAISLASS
jgi:hypothetical protein